MLVKQVLSILLVVACVSCSPALKEKSEPQEIDISEVPWQVTVQRFNYPFCAGSIISKEWILTTARCVMDTLQASYLSIRAGSSSDRAGGQIFEVKQFIMHEKFDRYVHDYDYALIQLNESIKFDATKQAIKLHDFGQDISVGTIVQETGWASSDDNPNLFLRRVELPIVNRKVCKDWNRDLKARMIGAGLKKGGKPVCEGTSGCPVTLMKNKTPVLVGVYSQTCDTTEVTDPLVVISRVSAGHKWISEKTGL